MSAVAVMAVLSWENCQVISWTFKCKHIRSSLFYVPFIHYLFHILHVYTDAMNININITI